MAGASITVERSSQLVGSRRRFRIMLDGERVGLPLAAGNSATVCTHTGVHELYVTSDGRVRKGHFMSCNDWRLDLRAKG